MAWNRLCGGYGKVAMSPRAQGGDHMQSNWQQRFRQQAQVMLLLLCLMLGVLLSSSAWANRLSDFMPELNAAEVFPGADRLGPVEGTPPVAGAYAGDELLGYVYITTDVVSTRGYSSFPIDTLISLSLDGTIVAAKLMEHHEPIVLIGIQESRVENFINGYVGQNYVKDPPAPGAPPPVDIISGATVTLLV